MGRGWYHLRFLPEDFLIGLRTNGALFAPAVALLFPFFMDFCAAISLLLFTYRNGINQLCIISASTSLCDQGIANHDPVTKGQLPTPHPPFSENSGNRHYRLKPHVKPCPAGCGMGVINFFERGIPPIPAACWIRFPAT